MDGENNGSKPYEQMDDLGGFPTIFENTHMTIQLHPFAANYSPDIRWGMKWFVQENTPGLKMYFLLNTGIFHCYVSLPEGRCRCWFNQ